MAVPASVQTESAVPGSPCPKGSVWFTNAGSRNDALQKRGDSEYSQRNEPPRPDWASDFDIDLIDSLRDVVNFLD